MDIDELCDRFVSMKHRLESASEALGQHVEIFSRPLIQIGKQFVGTIFSRIYQQPDYFRGPD